MPLVLELGLLLLLVDRFAGLLHHYPRESEFSAPAIFGSQSCTNRQTVAAAMGRSKLSCCGAGGSDRCRCPDKKAKKTKKDTKKDSPEKSLTAETNRLALQVELEQLRVQRLRLEEKKRSEKEAKPKWSHHTRWGQQGLRSNQGGNGSWEKTCYPYPSRSYHPQTWQTSQSSEISCRSWVRDEVAASLKHDGLH